MMHKGFIHKFGDHIDTDVIIPAEFLSQPDPEILAKGCFSNVLPGFGVKVRPGDFIFAGENFGCGSSREHAPIAIKATGIAFVVAASFSRIFYRSAINIGLSVVVCPEAIECAEGGGEAEIDPDAGILIARGQRFNISPFPPQLVEIIKAGGLVPYMRQRLEFKGKKGINS